jgi:sugar lactone lactonase YvrE
MNKTTKLKNVWWRRVILLVTLACLLALVVQIGVAQSNEAPAAVANGTLTVGKSTTPAGGQDFWITASSFQRSLRQAGPNLGRYRQPRDIEMDAAGNFYISENRISRITKIDTNGNFLMVIANGGKGQGKVRHPNAIAVSGNRLAVSDTSNNRIAIFNTNGSFIANWGSAGAGNGQFNLPQGVVFDSAGNLYVADTFNHRIQVLDSTGAYVRQWGTLGSADGQLRFPTHLDFDAAGNLYVVDSNNNRIQVFTAQGVFVRKIGGLGSGPGQFRLPVGLDIGADGFLYVSDTYNNRIQKLTTTGSFVGQWNQVASGSISRPNGVLSIGSLVLAADIDANSIQIFSQTSFLLDDGQQLSASLPAGAYNIVESAKSGWTFGGATCGSGSPTAITGGVRVTLTNGATVSCSFTNSQ